MKNRIYIIFILIPVYSFCQKSNFEKMDSLKIDSIALRWINTDTIQFDDYVITEFNKIEFAKNRILNARISKKISYFEEKIVKINKEIGHLRDSMITELQTSGNLEYKFKITDILFEIADSVSTKFLFDNINIAYNSQAWHSDVWEQYPIAKLLYTHSYFNWSFLKYIENRIVDSSIEDPMDYFYASFLKNIFQNNNEFLYIYLHGLIQQHPNNSILLNNIILIKNSL